MRSNLIVRRECQTHDHLHGLTDARCAQIGAMLEARDRFNGALPLTAILCAIRDKTGFVITWRRQHQPDTGDVLFPTALWLELDDGAFECAWMEAYSVAANNWQAMRVLHTMIVGPLALPADANCPSRDLIVLGQVAASKAMLALAREE
jgi:hypothetical protein